MSKIKGKPKGRPKNRRKKKRIKGEEKKDKYRGFGYFQGPSFYLLNLSNLVESERSDAPS